MHSKLGDRVAIKYLAHLSVILSTAHPYAAEGLQ